MASNNSIDRSILRDEPSREDEFHGKGHERTAAALARAIAGSSGNDRAIGLDGPWGSGKSTVVEIASNILTKQRAKNGAHYHFFTFDIWQTQGSSFRRSFLEHFLDWTMLTFPSQQAALEAIDRNVKGKVRHVQSRNQSVLDWWGVIVISTLPFLPLYYFWAKSVFDSSSATSPFLHSYPFILLVSFAVVTLAWAGWKCVTDKSEQGGRWWHNLNLRYRQALSQTLLISSKQFEDQKVTQYIRETDPNDFEFQKTLREILAIVQTEKRKIVLVLDNIDRLPKKEINEYWAQVRAVFSNGQPKARATANTAVVAIVPYDRHLVETEQKSKDSSVKTETKDTGRAALVSSLGSREIFSKTFNEILQVSPPVMSNSRDFFLEKIAMALPSVLDRDELFRVYLIFDQILRSANGNATPRQIIAFINELTGMYVLHDGRFRLPTVAVYIALQDGLEADPDILNQASSIDTRLRALADDNELEQNLAAIIFNVDPNLALQLLLDNRIKDAASRSAGELLQMSDAPGFDLRVDFVVQDSVYEWQQGGEYASVVSNFAELAKTYKGDALAHFSSSLVRSVRKLERLSLKPATYERVIKILDLVAAEDRLETTELLLHAAFRDLADRELNVESGRQWITFVGHLNRRLLEDQASAISASALSTISLPEVPDFMFGAAANIVKEGLTFNVLKTGRIELGEYETRFPILAVTQPAEASSAFLVMKAGSLLADSTLKVVFDALVVALSSAEIEDLTRFRHQLELAAEVYAYHSSTTRAELDATTMFGASTFYANLYQCMETGDEKALGSALFLAVMIYTEAGPPVPTIRGANSRVAENSDEFKWFAGHFTDVSGLSKDQFRQISRLFLQAAAVTSVISRGSAAPDHPLFIGIIRSALTDVRLPNINLANLLKHYRYLRVVVGSEMPSTLARLSLPLPDNAIAELQTEQLTPDFVLDIQSQTSNVWGQVIERIKGMLLDLPIADWTDRFTSTDELTQILFHLVERSDFKFTDPAFRAVYVDFTLGMLAGRYTVEAPDRYDLLLDSIPENFHPDILRQLREQIEGVGPDSLTAAAIAMPKTLSKMIMAADRITREEKDNLIRFLLCPALEGLVKPVIAAFESLGRAKIKDMMKASEESTRQKLKGASASFSTASRDRDWSKRVGELLYGRKETKNLFQIWFGKEPEEVDEAE